MRAIASAAALTALLLACRREPPPAAAARPHSRYAGPYRVGGEVTAPRVVRRVDAAPGKGTVLLEAFISRDGAVRDVVILKATDGAWGHRCADAVRRWTFTPGTLHGRPVDVIYDLTFRNPVQSGVPGSG
jgi:hypothetical protein